jgi:hypothetical protein
MRRARRSYFSQLPVNEFDPAAARLVENGPLDHPIVFIQRQPQQCAAHRGNSNCFAAAGPIRLPVTQDNSIVMVDGEWEKNAGQQGRIRVKGNQHIVAMAFDTSAIAGKRVAKATLVCVQGEEVISGVSISTIATPWDEQRSNGLTAGVGGTNGWGYETARFPAVCGGNAFTLVHQTQSIIRDGKSIETFDMATAGCADDHAGHAALAQATGQGELGVGLRGQRDRPRPNTTVYPLRLPQTNPPAAAKGRPSK